MNTAGQPRDIEKHPPGNVARARSPRNESEHASGAPNRPVVLLVDDLADNLVALEGMLRRDDIEIATATSGRAALEILRERDVALAIIDVQMPEMDGFELASLMRGVERTRYVPIIFVTAGSGDRARVFKGYEAGAVDYLVKPIDEEVIRGKVDVFVTLERHRQELREADRMREMFIAVLGHDLRNPLGGVLMAAQLIQRRSNGDDPNDAVLQRILRSGERMKRMIEQLLDATRFRKDGGVSLEPEPADLRDLADQILGELEDARSRIRLEALGDTSGTWDVDRILQVLSNLIANAVKHSPPGSPILLSIDGHAEDSIRLRVQNIGPPIPDELRGVLFEPFRRPEQRRRGDEGLGLGLYITKQLTLAHGGRISFSSTEDAGTCFTVSLPRRSPARIAEPVSRDGPNMVHARAAAATAGAEPTILVVEDESPARLALGELLENHGYRVLVAASPTQAIEAAANHQGSIDVLLTDVLLPGMSGDVLAEQLRSSHPGVQVIFMSGQPDPPDGSAAFVQKPIDVDMLIGIIKQTAHGHLCRR
jgi:signal transduction histidine kinase